MKSYKLEVKLTELATARFMAELKEASSKCKKAKDTNGYRLVESIIAVLESQIKKQQKRI